MLIRQTGTNHEMVYGALENKYYAGNGIKEVTVPNWGLGNYNYTIKVEGGKGEEQEVRPYRIKVKETRTKDAENDCTRQIEEFRRSQSRAESMELNRKHEEHYKEQVDPKRSSIKRNRKIFRGPKGIGRLKLI